MGRKGAVPPKRGASFVMPKAQSEFRSLPYHFFGRQGLGFKPKCISKWFKGSATAAGGQQTMKGLCLNEVAKLNCFQKDIF